MKGENLGDNNAGNSKEPVDPRGPGRIGPSNKITAEDIKLEVQAVQEEVRRARKVYAVLFTDKKIGFAHPVLKVIQGVLSPGEEEGFRRKYEIVIVSQVESLREKVREAAGIIFVDVQNVDVASKAYRIIKDAQKEEPVATGQSVSRLTVLATTTGAEVAALAGHQSDGRITDASHKDILEGIGIARIRQRRREEVNTKLNENEFYTSGLKHLNSGDYKQAANMFIVGAKKASSGDNVQTSLVALMTYKAGLAIKMLAGSAKIDEDKEDLYSQAIGQFKEAKKISGKTFLYPSLQASELTLAGPVMDRYIREKNFEEAKKLINDVAGWLEEVAEVAPKDVGLQIMQIKLNLRELEVLKAEQNDDGVEISETAIKKGYEKVSPQISGTERAFELLFQMADTLLKSERWITAEKFYREVHSFMKTMHKSMSEAERAVSPIFEIENKISVLRGLGKAIARKVKASGGKLKGEERKEVHKHFRKASWLSAEKIAILIREKGGVEFLTQDNPLLEELLSCCRRAASTNGNPNPSFYIEEALQKSGLDPVHKEEILKLMEKLYQRQKAESKEKKMSEKAGVAAL